MVTLVVLLALTTHILLPHTSHETCHCVPYGIVGTAMFCPFCRHPDSRVVDSRMSDDGLSIRRRRQCPLCGRRFSTTETASLNVIKRSGVVESFRRDKIVAGVRKACQGRPVTDPDLAILAQKVEETVRSSGASQLETSDIGLAILAPLRKLDEVAYLRFASVYQGFESLDDFEVTIALLRKQHHEIPVTGEQEREQ
jgi:transcriptional repressor NrdR